MVRDLPSIRPAIRLSPRTPARKSTEGPTPRVSARTAVKRLPFCPTEIVRVLTGNHFQLFQAYHHILMLDESQGAHGAAVTDLFSHFTHLPVPDRGLTPCPQAGPRCLTGCAVGHQSLWDFCAQLSRRAWPQIKTRSACLLDLLLGCSTFRLNAFGLGTHARKTVPAVRRPDW